MERLPADVHALIADNLLATDLVRLCMARKALAASVSSCRVWELECKQRWPLCRLVDPDAQDQKRLYCSYQQLFCKRMAMRSSFPDQCDLLHTVTKAAQAKAMPQRSDTLPLTSHQCPVMLRSHQSLELLLQQALELFSSLHARLARKPYLKSSKDFKVAVHDMSWWLNEHPKILVQHASEATMLGVGATFHLSTLLEAWPGQIHPSIVNRLKLISGQR